MTDWVSVLDQLEAEADAADGAIDAGDIPDATPFTPPTTLGPLPEALRDRALHVLRRQTDVETRLTALRAEIERELRATTKASTAGKSSYAAESAAPQYFNSAV